jgi:hypothetical protein
MASGQQVGRQPQRRGYMHSSRLAVAAVPSLVVSWLYVMVVIFWMHVICSVLDACNMFWLVAPL